MRKIRKSQKRNDNAKEIFWTKANRIYSTQRKNIKTKPKDTVMLAGSHEEVEAVLIAVVREGKEGDIVTQYGLDKKNMREQMIKICDKQKYKVPLSR